MRKHPGFESQSLRQCEEIHHFSVAILMLDECGRATSAGA